MMGFHAYDKDPPMRLPQITICDCVTERTGVPHVFIPRAQHEALVAAADLLKAERDAAVNLGAVKCAGLAKERDAIRRKTIEECEQAVIKYGKQNGVSRHTHGPVAAIRALAQTDEPTETGK